MANRRNLQNLINQKLQGLDKEDAISALENEDFEEVQTSEAALVETEVEDEMETTRASVANWFENHVLNK